MRKLLAVLALASFLSVLAACGGGGIFPGGGGGTPPVAPAITTQPQSMTVTAPQTATFSVVASGTATLSYQWKKNNANIAGATSSSYTTPATTTADSGSSFTVTVTNSAGNVTSNAAILTVNAASLTPQTITFNNPGTQTVGTPLTLSATASSGLAVSFASTTTGICTVSGTTATFIAAGTCTIQATQTGNSTYAAATPVSQSFTVNAVGLTPQTITFANPGTQTVGTPLTLSATASSGLTVSFASTTTSVCTVSGTTATFIAAGTCTIQATQPGNATYAAATPVSQSFTVNGRSQTITFANPGTQNVGTPLTLVATASSGLAVSFASQTTSICTVSGTTATFIATGTCTIQATQPGNSTYAAATPVSQSFTVNAAKPTISAFTANPTAISSGSSSTLSWTTSGATSIAITPGSFTSTLASGSTSVSPTATTTYTLTATNASGSTTATATVTVSTGGTLRITTTTCPGGTQGTAYAGCTISANGGTPPYTFSTDTSGNFPPLPEGMTLGASSGAISSSLIGGQGVYSPQFIVRDSISAQATQKISFAINGSNAFLANIFPSNSIFHHRMDAATTGLPVDNSPAAPIYSAYLTATIKPFFGNTSGDPFPNGIPAIEVPYNQPNVSVSTTMYQSYFTSGPIPAYAPVEGTSISGGDMHVLVYRDAGGGNKPALYEMWQGIYQVGGSWTDSSNALWPDVSSNALTPQGNGTSDAAGLPVAPLVVNADEVIGTGTPTAPNGAVHHPVRFTLNHMLNYWVWPSTATAGVGSCTAVGGGTIPTWNLISQSAPPASCTMSGPAGEIYRLKASAATPACASSSPQAAIIITGFRNYGIILSDNGISGGLIGTPDARWNDNDLQCLTSLHLSDFEPVNVSSLMISTDSGATNGALTPQTITFSNPGTQTVGAPLTLSATASSGLAVSFASTTTSVCTVSGTTATLIAAGTCTIQATQAGNGTYAAATPVSQSFTVNPISLLPQTITFANPGTQTVGTPLTLSATASSGLTVSFASTTTSICTVSGTTATFVASGSCTIQATQAGNSTYAAATPVSRSFTVNAASVLVTSITIPSTASVSAGATTTLTATVLPANATNKTLTWTSNDTTTATVSGGVVTGIKAGSVTVTAKSTDGSNITSNNCTVTVTSSSADVTITINPSVTKPISPWIYGENGYADDTSAHPHLTFDRQGGNRLTAYNWENNYSNAGSDWLYENDNYMSSSTTPTEAVRSFIAADEAVGAASLMTIQLQGYVSADGDANTSVDPYGADRATRFKQVVYKKSTKSSAAFTVTPPTNDAYVYMDEFLWALDQKLSGKNIFGANPTVPTFVSLDNEPELWNSTHSEVQTTTPESSDDYISKTIGLTQALKDQFPNVVVFGPVHYGYAGIASWQVESFPNGEWFTEKYLRAMKTASLAYDPSGQKRLLDVYDFHWYSEATDSSGNRVTGLTSSTLTDDQVQAIVQSPRSLWDTTYTENSWITNDVLGGPIYLLGRLQSKINATYSGTKIAITEYENGGFNHIAGTIAQADNLGIFGAQGVFAASFWPPSGGYPYTLAGFRAFRGFDGANANFGDTSIQATSSNVAKVAVYASSDSTTPGRLVFVAINRSTSSQVTAISGQALSGTAYLYRITATSAQGQNPIVPVSVGTMPVSGSSVTVTLPALSVTTIEVR